MAYGPSLCRRLAWPQGQTFQHPNQAPVATTIQNEVLVPYSSSLSPNYSTTLQYHFLTDAAPLPHLLVSICFLLLTGRAMHELAGAHPAACGRCLRKDLGPCNCCAARRPQTTWRLRAGGAVLPGGGQSLGCSHVLLCVSAGDCV